MTSPEQSGENVANSPESAPEIGAVAQSHLDTLKLPELPRGARSEVKLSENARHAREYIKSHPEECILLLARVQGEQQGERLARELPRMLSALEAEGQAVTLLELEYFEQDAMENDFGESGHEALSLMFTASSREGIELPEKKHPYTPIVDGVGGLRHYIQGAKIDYINALRGL